MWHKTIDLNAPAKLRIDFCGCGESKMFVLFHKPISCKETPFPDAPIDPQVCGSGFIVKGSGLGEGGGRRSIKDQ